MSSTVGLPRAGISIYGIVGTVGREAGWHVCSMKTVVDFDNTLTGSKELFVGASDKDPAVLAQQKSPAFQELLLALPPYPWVEQWKSRFAFASQVVVVSGRGEHLRLVTAEWIERELCIKPKMVLVGFTDYGQYLKDKVDLMSFQVFVLDATRRRGEKIHFFEDDMNVLKGVYKTTDGLPDLVFHCVVGGVLGSFEKEKN